MYFVDYFIVGLLGQSLSCSLSLSLPLFCHRITLNRITCWRRQRTRPHKETDDRATKRRIINRFAIRQNRIVVEFIALYENCIKTTFVCQKTAKRLEGGERCANLSSVKISLGFCLFLAIKSLKSCLRNSIDCIRSPVLK